MFFLLCVCLVGSDDVFDGCSAHGALGVATADEVFAADEADAHVTTLIEDGVGVVVQTDEAVSVVDRCALHCRGCGSLTCQQQSTWSQTKTSEQHYIINNTQTIN